MGQGLQKAHTIPGSDSRKTTHLGSTEQAHAQIHTQEPRAASPHLETRVTRAPAGRAAYLLCQEVQVA